MLDQPQALRFRALRLANPTVAHELLACPGARALLECAGFVHELSTAAARDQRRAGIEADAPAATPSAAVPTDPTPEVVPPFAALARAAADPAADPGRLVLPLASDLAAVRAARSRLTREAHRRVRCGDGALRRIPSPPDPDTVRVLRDVRITLASDPGGVSTRALWPN